MENFARRLRQALSMSQADFAQATGLSYATIQTYEAGRRISDESLAILIRFAHDRGRPDLIPPGHLVVKKVFRPAPVSKAGQALDLHALVDEVLSSGDPTMVLTLENFLLYLTQYLRKDTP